MRYSTVFAGISAFCSVEAVLTMPVTLVFDMESIRESGAALPYTVYLAYLIIVCVCAVRSAKEAVSWIRDLREKSKTDETEEGIDRMTKRLTGFLFPRVLFRFLPFCMLVMFGFPALNTRLHEETHANGDDPVLVVILVLLGAFALWMAFYAIREIREYDRHVKNLKESGMFSQAVLDYYAGNTYCEGKVTVGTKYIFIEGLGRIIDYNEFQKIYARLVSYRSSSDWTLFEVEKDGTEVSLGALPYGQQSKKAYDEKILPMLNEIEERKRQWSTEPV